MTHHLLQLCNYCKVFNVKVYYLTRNVNGGINSWRNHGIISYSDTSTLFSSIVPSRTSISNSWLTSDASLMSSIVCWCNRPSNFGMYVRNDNLMQFSVNAMTFRPVNASSICSMASNLKQLTEQAYIRQGYKIKCKQKK